MCTYPPVDKKDGTKRLPLPMMSAASVLHCSALGWAHNRKHECLDVGTKVVDDAESLRPVQIRVRG